MIMSNEMERMKKLAHSIKEISESTGLSEPYLRLEIKRGKLKGKRFGRRVVVMAEDLDQYLKNAEPTV
jgi:excisionase family DNA binding protein